MGVFLLGSVKGSLGTDTNALPNIVLIFTDDLGYEDVGCFDNPTGGEAKITTPNIDQMAAEGMKLTDFHVGMSMCSPSRAALLTGCYPPRVSVPMVYNPFSTEGLHPDEITIAELLKTKGYATACIGKWHLGHHPNMLPTRQGFDIFFGLPDSNNRSDEFTPGDPPLPLYDQETVVEVNPDQRFLTRRYTEKAVDFIKNNQHNPFFLYLPHTMPHIPIFVTPEFEGKSTRPGVYGDSVEEIDWSVGVVLDTLKELGLDEKTLVIFTSDNGPNHVSSDPVVRGSASPFQGAKWSTWEGGFLVPAVFRWPGKIPAGSVNDEITATIDLLPTFAGLTGIPLPSDRVIDGVDIWAILSGGTGDPERVFYYYRHPDADSIRAVRQNNVVINGTPVPGKWKWRLGELYNLANDPHEDNNVRPQYPEIVDALLDLRYAFNPPLQANKRPPATPTTVGTAQAVEF